MDTKLGYMSLLLEVHGAEIAQGRVPACGIVEAFDVIEHVLSRVVARVIGFACDPFGLQRGEEALHRSVVPDVAGPAHRAGDAIVDHQPLELLAGILAALVRVMQQRIGLATAPDRHDQRIGDELRRHRVAHRPADYPPREEIDHCGSIQPSFSGPDVSEVGHPLLIGRVRGELPIEHIAGDHRAFAMILG